MTHENNKIIYCYNCGCELFTENEIAGHAMEQEICIGYRGKETVIKMHPLCQSCVDEEKEELEKWLNSNEAKIEAEFESFMKKEIEKYD